MSSYAPHVQNHLAKKYVEQVLLANGHMPFSPSLSVSEIDFLVESDTPGKYASIKVKTVGTRGNGRLYYHRPTQQSFDFLALVWGNSVAFFRWDQVPPLTMKIDEGWLQKFSREVGSFTLK